MRVTEDNDKFIENFDSLIEKVMAARDLSHYTYEAVFKRRQKMEFYRHGTATVQRFHYVFDLLSSIHKSIKSRNHRAIVADHKKLQQLIGKNQVRVLQNVFEEVEAKVDSLRTSLRDELKVMPGNVDQQILLCRNLAELEDDSDPGWDCLNNLHLYTMEKMFEIYSFYFSDVAGAISDVHRALQQKTFQKLDFRIHVASPFDLEFDGIPNVDGSTNVTRERNEAITDSATICQLMKVLSDTSVERLRHFFRLSEAFFQSEMKEGVRDVAAVVDAVKYSRQREMVLEIVHLFVVIIQCTLKPKEALVKAEEFYHSVLAIQNVRKALTGHGEGTSLLKTMIIQMKKALVMAVLERGVTGTTTIG